MSDIDQNISGVKTDVALIKKDIKQIEKFFSKYEYIIEKSADRDKRVAVQHEILNNVAEKIENLDIDIKQTKVEIEKDLAIVHDRLEQYRSSSREDHQRLSDNNAQHRKERNEEIMVALSKLNGNLDKRISEMEGRVTSLDRWKWYMMGMGAIVIFIVTKLDLPKLFG
jgi:DNA anti-recombination protein RmuC